MSTGQRLRIRRALRRHEDALEREALTKGELSIVPLLDVIVNLVVFLLATASMVGMASEVAADTPASCAHCRPAPPSLDLTVIVTAHTIRVAGSGGQLAPGCSTTGVGPAIVRDGHEWEALRDCARRVHAAFPLEHEVRLTADPLVPYEDTIAAMDALRGDEDGLLFDDVLLAAGVR
ncbi:MAG: biopolymer transporter ExbD [Sandaracinaceae bacterium]|nr:biopolymer transporter ExbD [Sandaracinaceae bacterium]